eukprot:UN14797
MRSLGLEKVMRDLRIFRIFEGTNDILRLFVALQGIQYAGGHLRELQKAISNPVSNFGVVLGEVAKRGKGAIGIGPGNILSDQVPSQPLRVCRPHLQGRGCLWSVNREDSHQARKEHYQRTIHPQQTR